MPMQAHQSTATQRPVRGSTRRRVLAGGLAVAGGVAAGLASELPETVANEAAAAAGRRSRRLIRGGNVISMDPTIGNLPVGDVLIEDGRIIAVGVNLPRQDAEGIDARGKIVIPGFVNSHTHLVESAVRGLSANATPQEHRALVLGPLPEKLDPEGVYIGTLIGALNALANGNTMVLNWDLVSTTPEQARAAVDALADAGVRGLHSYSTPQALQNDPGSPPHPDDIRALVEYMSRYPLLSPHVGARNPVGRGDAVLQGVIDSFRLAREELGATISIHAGQPTSVATPHLLNEHGLLGDDLVFVNGSAFTEIEFALLAEHGSWVVTAPEAELQSATPPPLARLLAAGLRPVVCTDSYAYNSSYMPQQLNVLLRYARSQNIGTASGLLTTERVFPYGNIHPAMSLGMFDSIGSLTPGKRADVVLVDPRAGDGLDMLGTTDVFTDLVVMAQPYNIDTVLVDGRVVKRHGRLLGHDLSRLRRELLRIQAQVLA